MLSAPARGPPLISTTRAYPSLISRRPWLRSRPRSTRIGSSRDAAASGRFGVTSAGARNELCAKGSTASLPTTAGRRALPPSQDRARRAWARSVSAPRHDRLDVASCATRPIFTAPTSRSSESTAVDLRGHERRTARAWMPPGHAFRFCAVTRVMTDRAVNPPLRGYKSERRPGCIRAAERNP